TVSAPGSAPARARVVERAPASPGAPQPTRSYADLRWTGDQAAVVHVEAPSAGMTLVRIPFDPGWHATVDGRPVPVVPADYVDLAVPVGQGRHDIELRYRAPGVRYGLAAPAAGLLARGLAALQAARAGRRARPERAQPPR